MSARERHAPVRGNPLLTTLAAALKTEASLPARERGLKLATTSRGDLLLGSLPARERGLKQQEPYQLEIGIHVAPRAGAWIETKRLDELLAGIEVAPRAGAWIETYHAFKSDGWIMSLPARERGLKHGECTMFAKPIEGRSPRGSVD